MRDLTTAEAKRQERKIKGTKYPFNLLYLLFCDDCRENIIKNSTARRRSWHELHEMMADLATDCKCYRLLCRAELNLKGHPRIRFNRAAWHTRKKVTELEEYRDRLLVKIRILLGYPKRQLMQKLENDSLYGPNEDTPGHPDITDDWEESHINIRKIKNRVWSSPVLSSQLNETSNLSAGRHIILRGHKCRGPVAPIDYITPYGWTFTELYRSPRKQPKIISA